MNSTVIFCENAADISSWHTVENVQYPAVAIRDYYGDTLPDGVKIYHNDISDEADVTPHNQDTVRRLFELTGTFYVTMSPQFFLGGILGTIIKIIITGVLLFLLAPKPPKPRNTRATSPNNDLSERTNEARPNERIPGNYGTLVSTPDLLKVPLRYYENHNEVELSYMCIGRGEYRIDPNKVKDDTTLISDIAGSSVEIYKPFTSPLSGDEPQLSIGEPIDDVLRSPKRSNSVTGQVLRAPNENEVNGSNNIVFVYPDSIEVLENTDVDFTDFFQKDDVITVTKATFNGPSINDGTFGGGTQVNVNLNGDYVVLGVNPNQIALVNPITVNPDWDKLSEFTDGASDPTSANITTDSPKWVGPFTLDRSDITASYSNVRAVQGLFKDNGEKQIKLNVDIEFEYTPVDADGNAIGPIQIETVKIFGSNKLKSERAATIKSTFNQAGRHQVRARRLTNTDLSFEGTVVDEIKWSDLYSLTAVNKTHFGDVSTAYTKTIANAGALSIKERKFNLEITRLVPSRGTGALIASDNVSDIFVALCLDPKIGNRTIDEVDIDNIYSTVDDVRGYFGINKAIEFSHTFDDKNASFEEIITSVADTMFCSVYRLGNKIKVHFEKPVIDSTLLFCHRNMLPRSERRTVRLGNLDEKDGVEIEYTDPEDETKVKYYVPEDRSALNPETVEFIGIRSKILARFHAYRLYNKILYQNMGVEFDATAEASILTINERVLIADTTREETIAGHIESANGLILNLSREVSLDSTVVYSIFLQLSDGSVESIPVTQVDAFNVALSRPPTLSLITDDNSYVKTAFEIVPDNSSSFRAFLISERSRKENRTYGIQAFNYDDKYYSNDKDFINGIVDEEGELV